MEVIVRHFLTAVDAVILKRQDAERLVRVYQCNGNALRRPDDGGPFFVGYVQQGACMPLGNYAALAGFELIWVDHGHCMRALDHSGPSGIATGQAFANLAWFLPGKLDH